MDGLDAEALRRGIGLAAALIGSGAYVPYIHGTLTGRLVPERASWLIWSVLSSIAFASLLAEGAGRALYFVGAQTGGTITVFLLSLRSGAGTTLSRIDLTVLAVSAIGLVLWYATGNPLYALAISIAISALAGSVTVTKAWRRPETETLAMWVPASLASGLAVLANDPGNWVGMVYPGFLCGLYGAIAGAMVLGRRMRTRRHA